VHRLDALLSSKPASNDDADSNADSDYKSRKSRVSFLVDGCEEGDEKCAPIMVDGKRGHRSRAFEEIILSQTQAAGRAGAEPDMRAVLEKVRPEKGHKRVNKGSNKDEKG
jgi:hypothetical protein